MKTIVKKTNDKQMKALAKILKMLKNYHFLQHNCIEIYIKQYCITYSLNDNEKYLLLSLLEAASLEVGEIYE